MSNHPGADGMQRAYSAHQGYQAKEDAVAAKHEHIYSVITVKDEPISMYCDGCGRRWIIQKGAHFLERPLEHKKES